MIFPDKSSIVDVVKLGMELIVHERVISELATIDSEVSELVEEAYKRATKVLTENRLVLDELAEMLVEKETVDSEDLQDLLIRREVKIAAREKKLLSKNLMKNKFIIIFPLPQVYLLFDL